MKQLVFIKKQITPSIITTITLITLWVTYSICHFHGYSGNVCSPICMSVVVINLLIIFGTAFILLIALFVGSFDNYKITVYLPSFQVSKEDELLIQIGQAAVEGNKKLEEKLFTQLDKLKSEKV